jgi:hypothetical protein
VASGIAATIRGDDLFKQWPDGRAIYIVAMRGERFQFSRIETNE